MVIDLALDYLINMLLPGNYPVGSLSRHGKSLGYSNLTILGTRLAMCGGRCTERLEAQGIATLVPDDETGLEVDQIIFDDLTQGEFTDFSGVRHVEIAHDLKDRVADAVALSCSESGLLVSPESTPLPAIGSVDVHVAAIVKWMMTEEPALLGV